MSEEPKVPLPELDRNGGAMPSDVTLAPDASETTRTASDLEAVFDVPVQVSAVLGRTKMDIGDLLKLGPGAVLELDRKVGEAIDIYINNRLVARGEVVLVEEKLGVTMTEMIKAEEAEGLHRACSFPSPRLREGGEQQAASRSICLEGHRRPLALSRGKKEGLNPCAS